jgi:hypothetical protein
MNHKALEILQHALNVYDFQLDFKRIVPLPEMETGLMKRSRAFSSASNSFKQKLNDSVSVKTADICISTY